MVPDPVLLWALFVFVCAFLPFLTWFCFFLVCFLKRERKEGCGLGRWGGAWDMGGVGREENLIRMYCIVLKNFNKNVWKKEFFVSRYRIESSLHRTVQSWSLATLTLLALINHMLVLFIYFFYSLSAFSLFFPVLSRDLISCLPWKNKATAVQCVAFVLGGCFMDIGTLFTSHKT